MPTPRNLERFSATGGSEALVASTALRCTVQAAVRCHDVAQVNDTDACDRLPQVARYWDASADRYLELFRISLVAEWHR